MTWKIKSENADGTVSETVHDNFNAALKSLNDLKHKGIAASMEDAEGKPVDLNPDCAP